MKKKEKKRRQEFSSVWAICNSRFVGVRVMEATKLRLALAQSSWLLNVPYAVKSLNLCPVLNTRVFPSMSPVIFLWFEKENENKTKQNSGKKKRNQPNKQTKTHTHSFTHKKKEDTTERKRSHDQIETVKYFRRTFGDVNWRRAKSFNVSDNKSSLSAWKRPKESESFFLPSPLMSLL